MIGLTWVLTVSCIIGAILNAKKCIAGFYIWIPANILWVLLSIRTEAYAQATLFGVYTVIAIFGIIKWRK